MVITRDVINQYFSVVNSLPDGFIYPWVNAGHIQIWADGMFAPPLNCRVTGRHAPPSALIRPLWGAIQGQNWALLEVALVLLT